MKSDLAQSIYLAALAQIAAQLGTTIHTPVAGTIQTIAPFTHAPSSARVIQSGIVRQHGGK